MEYYTLMTIGYEFINHPMQFSIWFSSENKCWETLMGNNNLYDQINATEGYCQVSDITSYLVKPKLRPW